MKDLLESLAMSQRWSLRPMLEGSLHSADLGSKLRDCLEKHQKRDSIIFIGGDCVDLSALSILNAIEVTATGDAFICPAVDGG